MFDNRPARSNQRRRKGTLSRMMALSINSHVFESQSTLGDQQSWSDHIEIFPGARLLQLQQRFPVEIF